MENLSENRDGIKEHLSLTHNGTLFLKETAKWAQFLSILGFIMVGFMILLALFMGTILSFIPQTAGLPIQGGLIGIIYIVLSAIYFFPALYLYKFSSKIKEAIKLYDDTYLEKALQYLKSHYKFIGILMIIILSMYLLFFVVSIGAALTGLF